MMPLGSGLGGGVMRGGPARPVSIGRPVASPRSPIASPMMPSMPRSFKKGGKVKRGGYGKLHKGEVVIPRKAAKALGAGKKQSKTKRLIEAAGKEIKKSPPKVLATTARKSGAKQTNKQRVAIMLSKARAAGANIPEK